MVISRVVPPPRSTVSVLLRGLSPVIVPLVNTVMLLLSVVVAVAFKVTFTLVGVGITETKALPVTPPLVAVTVAVPAWLAVYTPVLGSIEPTPVLLHVTVAAIVSPNWSRVVAVKFCVLPLIRVTFDGETVIVVNTRGASVI